ncbi:unnamed protein product [Onchocerca ochengi]|uniref:Transmembrane protein n=1 Tax=Onchocerca ochengi TaxID=42157 RepID=A0A182DYA8_ONCOC|nr:unnamed protein product [Onchocerca ochengi]
MHLKNVSREMRPRVGGALKDSGHLKEEKGGGRIQDDWKKKKEDSDSSIQMEESQPLSLMTMMMSIIGTLLWWLHEYEDYRMATMITPT